ncbi:hypothetical protein [Streptomyces humidus]|uniref:hypothetical protein n=1 Tax=Streptomyces humidus TaxID=52259 RepID=UPI003D9F35E4
MDTARSLESSMNVRRVVPVLRSDAVPESREFHGLPGFEAVMNDGWITTLAPPSAPAGRRSGSASSRTTGPRPPHRA